MWKLGLTKRMLIASIVVGSVGAIVSGLLVFFYFRNFVLDGWRTNPYISAAIMFVVGFVCCFFAFRTFLKRVEGKKWKRGLQWGLIICSPLGALLGFMTGIVVDSVHYSGGLYHSIDKVLANIFFLGFIGLFYGLPIGIVVGLVFGSTFTLIIKRFDLSSKQLS